MSDLISFDYAIKYLLKDKADYDIVGGFISALLGSEGYPPVKIKTLLESESNRECKDAKRTVADLVVEDENGNNYIIEIDRSHTTLFLHKAIFNTSRLIVDSMGSGDSVFKIKKVFHINLLYFRFEDIKAPLHHGQMRFHEVHSKHSKRLVESRLMDRGSNVLDRANIFPEYFLISVPLFNDVVKEEFDEWMYFMKNGKVKESFKSPYIQKLAKRLQTLKMSQEERYEYFAYMKEYSTRENSLECAREEGMEKGIEKEKINIAKEMLGDGVPIETISKFTKLSIEKIKALK